MSSTSLECVHQTGVDLVFENGAFESQNWLQIGTNKQAPIYTKAYAVLYPEGPDIITFRANGKYIHLAEKGLVSLYQFECLKLANASQFVVGGSMCNANIVSSEVIRPANSRSYIAVSGEKPLNGTQIAIALDSIIRT